MTQVATELRFGQGASGNAWLRRGWSNPEADFVWAVGARSSLTLSLLPVVGRVIVELDLQPFVLPPALASRRVDVAVNGVVLARETLAIRGVLRVEVPASLREAPGLLVELHHPEAHTPAELGLGDDPRRLAIQLYGLKIVTIHARDLLPPPAGPVAQQACYRFGGNTQTAPMLGEGWGAPEFEYVWSVGRRSILRLPAEASAAERTLVLDIRPYIDNTVPQQRIAIGADGQLLGFISISQRTTVAFTLPPTRGAKFIEVTFDNMDAAAPRDTGLYADGRPFVFMLVRVRVLLRRNASNAPVSRDGGAEPAARELVACFESLGSMCEMGLLQRRLGYEPVGLLRFAGITTPHLVDGIFEGFPGLGRSDRLIVESRAASEHTYFVVDDHHALSMQTSISSRRVGVPDLKRQMSRYLPFLVRKFFEDLAAAEKIFVFQRRDATIRAEADAVLAALSVWGDATLLWVQQDPTRSGELERLSPRLLGGFVDGTDEGWLKVLSKARKEALLF